MRTMVGEEEEEARLFVCVDGQMDGQNEERGKRKDIFIRIILRHRISSGKVAQWLVNTPPTHTQADGLGEAGKPTGAPELRSSAPPHILGGTTDGMR